MLHKDKSFQIYLLFAVPDYLCITADRFSVRTLFRRYYT